MVPDCCRPAADNHASLLEKADRKYVSRISCDYPSRLAWKDQRLRTTSTFDLAPWRELHDYSKRNIYGGRTVTEDRAGLVTRLGYLSSKLGGEDTMAHAVAEGSLTGVDEGS